MQIIRVHSTDTEMFEARTAGNPSSTRRSRSRRQRCAVDVSRARGAAVVEFALVMPVLVMMMLGTVTAGIAINQKLDMSHGVREGARYGATVSPSQTWVSGTWASNVRDLVVSRSGGDLASSQVCVALVVSLSSLPGTTVVYSSGGSSSSYTTNTDGSPCFGDTYPLYSSSDSGLRVQVYASRPAKIELGILPPITSTLTTSATARLESGS